MAQIIHLDLNEKKAEEIAVQKVAEYDKMTRQRPFSASPWPHKPVPELDSYQVGQETGTYQLDWDGEKKDSEKRQ